MTQTTPPVIRLRSSRDVLATVPRLLGYRPRDSIVFLSLHEEKGVSTMRLDLPPAGDELLERRLATTIVGMLCKVPEVLEVVVVIYSSDAFWRVTSGRGRPPRAGFAQRLLERVDASGFEVHDALIVAADGWGRYRGSGPVERHPLEELETPAEGTPEAPVAEGVAALAALPFAGPLSRRAFAQALDRRLDALDDRPEPDAAEIADAALALDPTGAEHERLAELLCALLCPDCRDVVLYSWAWGPDRGRELAVQGELIASGREPADESLVLDLMGLGDAAPPERQRIDRAIVLVRRLAALAAVELQHVPLTVLAWLHWAQGAGSLAGLHVDRARRLDPGYGLAELLQSVLGQGMLPGWAYTRPGRGGPGGVG